MSDADDIELGPSKSQRKRDAHAIKDLGERLVNLEPGQLKKFDLPETLVTLIQDTRRIRQHGARKRQLQYLAKQLRQIDSDVLQQQLEQLQRPHQDDVTRLHQIERWRERLLQDGPETVTEFMRQYPQTDPQQLRQLIRNARKEAQKHTAPKSARLLFKYLREILGPAHSEAPAQD